MRDDVKMRLIPVKQKQKTKRRLAKFDRPVEYEVKNGPVIGPRPADDLQDFPGGSFPFLRLPQSLDGVVDVVARRVDGQP